MRNRHKYREAERSLASRASPEALGKPQQHSFGRALVYSPKHDHLLASLIEIMLIAGGLVDPKGFRLDFGRRQIEYCTASRKFFISGSVPSSAALWKQLSL
jgi:hypothetical protein